MALGSASRRTAARSSAVEYSSGKASIGARVGCVAAAWRRRSVSALLHAQVAGADVFSARCSRLPLVVSSTGAGGWAERASRPRGRRRSADGRLSRAGGRRVDHLRCVLRSSLGKPVRASPRSAAFPVVSWSTPAISDTPPGNCRVLVERTQQFRRGSDRFGFGRARAAGDAVQMSSVGDARVTSRVLGVLRDNRRAVVNAYPAAADHHPLRARRSAATAPSRRWCRPPPRSRRGPVRSGAS